MTGQSLQAKEELNNIDLTKTFDSVSQLGFNIFKAFS